MAYRLWRYTVSDPALIIVAQRGASVLINVGDGRGRILDRRHGRLYEPQAIDSALARGYWEPFCGSVKEIQRDLTVAEEVRDDANAPGLLVGLSEHRYRVEA
jgi:hypothetical protein